MNCSRLARTVEGIEKTLRFANRHGLFVPQREEEEHRLKHIEQHIDEQPYRATATTA